MRICSENDVRPEQSAPGVTDAVGPGARNVDHAKAQARYYGSMTAEGKPSTPDALPFTAARHRVARPAEGSATSEVIDCQTACQGGLTACRPGSAARKRPRQGSFPGDAFRRKLSHCS